MAFSKVILNDETLMDVTNDTVATDNLLAGYTATGADGVRITGSATGGGGGYIDTVEILPNGAEHHIITGVDLSSDTVSANVMLSGYTAHNSLGTAVTGNIQTKTSANMTVNGATVTAPAGYYASNASASVASGTAGTPTATKGAVSSHSISVTPSVTNTTGYITGSTISGTAVSVSASELVSGNKSITENGSNIDVTNYATVSVDVNAPEVTISSSGAVSQSLQPGTIYHFTSTALTSLTITFASFTSTAQYHFDFISPSTAVTLTLPQDVVMPNNFSVEVNTKYEIDIVNNYGVFAEWVYEAS